MTKKCKENEVKETNWEELTKKLTNVSIDDVNKNMVRELLNERDIDWEDVKNAKGEIVELKFDICDVATIAFNLKTMRYDYINVFEGKKIDYIEMCIIEEYIGIYYNAYIREWKKETDENE